MTDEATGETYTGNIDAVIAEYGSAVPASFLQKAAIVLVDGTEESFDFVEPVEEQ